MTMLIFGVLSAGAAGGETGSQIMLHGVADLNISLPRAAT